MEIKRSYIFVEDHEGNLYRVISDQNQQLSALNLLAKQDKHGELPVAKDVATNIKPLSDKALNELKKPDNDNHEGKH